MVRQVSLVRSKQDAFRCGLLAENIDELSKDASQFDAFILTEPGVPARKVPDGLITQEIMSVSHRYSNIQGNNYLLLISLNLKNLGKPQDAHYYGNSAENAENAEQFRFQQAVATLPARVS